LPESTTEGYSATPAEIEGMVRNLCAYALTEPDPMQRYVELTQQQVLFEGMTEAICRERGNALADLLIAGVPIADVAAKTNLKTVQKVRKLVGAAGATERVRAATARKAATRKATTGKATTRKATPRKATMPADAGPPPYLPGPADRRLLTEAERIALGLQAPASKPSRTLSGRSAKKK
jgi:hypothetical protein